MGLPELFTTRGAYDEFVDLLVRAGRIKDASFIWWYLRPSTKFPTLELRICDSCTSVDDAVAIAALYRCLVRTTVRRTHLNADIGTIERGVCAENVWQAQRGGVTAQFVVRGSPRLVPVADIVASALELVAEDADALGCAAWIGRIAMIIERGTSADHQIAAFRNATGHDQNVAEALRAVVRHLAQTTTAQLESGAVAD